MKKIAKSLIKSCIPSGWIQYRGRSKDAVCLTFDDGPHPNTEKILGILRENGAKASFFLNGCQVKKYPDLAKKIQSDGHFIGNHFFDHVSVKELTLEGMKRQVEDGENIIRGVTGASANAVRPPYGDCNAAFLFYAVRTARKIILWSLDGEDGDAEKSTLQSIRARCATLRGGDILLLHEDNPYTLQALPDIIWSARARGLKFSTVEE